MKSSSCVVRRAETRNNLQAASAAIAAMPATAQNMELVAYIAHPNGLEGAPVPSPATATDASLAPAGAEFKLLTPAGSESDFLAPAGTSNGPLLSAGAAKQADVPSGPSPAALLSPEAIPSGHRLLRALPWRHDSRGAALICLVFTVTSQASKDSACWTDSFKFQIKATSI